MPRTVDVPRCGKPIRVNDKVTVKCQRSLGHSLFCGAWFRNEWVVANNQKGGEEE